MKRPQLKAKLMTALSLLGRTAIFLIALACVLSLLSVILKPKDNTAGAGMPYPPQEAYVSEPRGSIDIFVLGDSSGYADFSPMEIWQRTGYTSYTACEPAGRVSSALSILGEVTAAQSPKLLIIDLNMLFDSAANLGTTVYDHLWGDFPILRYHRAWKSFDIRKLFTAPVYTYHDALKGQGTGTQSRKYDGSTKMSENHSSAAISWFAQTAFEELLSKCRQHGLTVLLVDFPNVKNWSNARHDAAVQIAQSHGLPFLDFNELETETSIDWHEDTVDGGVHLNYLGARKVSAYLSAYLKENYGYLLTDHRSDPAYASEWNADYEKYRTITGF